MLPLHCAAVQPEGLQYDSLWANLTRISKSSWWLLLLEQVDLGSGAWAYGMLSYAAMDLPRPCQHHIVEQRMMQYQHAAGHDSQLPWQPRLPHSAGR